MSDLILDYTILTDPDPLPTNATGKVKLLVSNPNPHRAISIQDITVSFLGGDGARDLTRQDGTRNVRPVAPAGWGHSYDPSGEATFTPTSDEARHMRTEGALFEFQNVEVSGALGNATFNISERISVDNAPAQTATLNAEIPKFPAQYRFDHFYADPVSVDFGGSVTLCWKGSTGASYVIKYDDTVVTHVVGNPDKKLPAEGSLTISPLYADTNFTLEVSFGGTQNGPILRQYAPVHVNKARIDQFIADPLEIKPGAQSTLSWVTNADTCTISPGIGKVDAPTGKVVVTADVTTTYTLSATKGGNVAQKDRVVTVPNQVIKDFSTCAVLPVQAEDEIVLKWDTAWDTKLELSYDDTTIDVTGITTHVVRPLGDTTYVLTAYGVGPAVTKSLKVPMVDPEITTLELDYLGPSAHPTLRFICTATNAGKIQSIIQFADGTQQVKVTGDGVVRRKLHYSVRLAYNSNHLPVSVMGIAFQGGKVTSEKEDY